MAERRAPARAEARRRERRDARGPSIGGLKRPDRAKLLRQLEAASGQSVHLEPTIATLDVRPLPNQHSCRLKSSKDGREPGLRYAESLPNPRLR
ncbi:MAG TPA: hypothetical protein VGP88_08100 [Thermoplasmata archaeon]|nr:hypothetical protein [Thermoplasmata archaeon]